MTQNIQIFSEMGSREDVCLTFIFKLSDLFNPADSSRLVTLFKTSTISFQSPIRSLRLSTMWNNVEVAWNNFQTAQKSSHLMSQPIYRYSVFQHGHEISDGHSQQRNTLIRAVHRAVRLLCNQWPSLTLDTLLHPYTLRLGLTQRTSVCVAAWQCNITTATRIDQTL